MAAPFREGLVFDVKACDTGSLKRLDRLPSIERIAVARIHISDRRYTYRIYDLRQTLRNLRHADQTHVGDACATCHTAAGDVHRRKTRRFYLPGREPVIAAWRNDDAIAFNQFP